MAHDGVSDGPSLTDVQLRSLSLWECSIERGTTETLSAGQLNAETSVEPSAEGDYLAYLVKGEYEFLNHKEELMAKITSSFLLAYEVADAERLTEDDVESFSKSVVMQVTPFQREFLASVTSRLGIPTFYLPLIRLSELEYESGPPAEQ